MGALKAFAAVALLLVGRAHSQGLQVNLDSPSSIRAAAKTVARNLMDHYHGDEPGQTIGILPGPPPGGPYYWWQAGAMFGTLIDYWHYTGDTEYNDVTRQALVFQASAPDYSYMPPNWTLSLGNDDQGFWGMAAMLAAETGFPDPAPEEPQYLALAQAVFNTQAARWQTQDCNGGLRWQIFSGNTGYNYKNTIANACFLNIAARLARYTNNDTYAEWAEKTWDWTKAVGYISDDYDVYDGADAPKNCTNLHEVQFSYNAAILMHSAAIMYNYTGADKWKDRVAGLLNRTESHFFLDGILVERSCELEDRMQCNIDQHSFKGYMHRALATVAAVAEFTRPNVLRILRSSTKGLVSSCLADGTCGFRWNIGGYDGDVANGPAGQQMSGVAALSTLLVEETLWKPPLTTDTGGTSQGNPGAGRDPDILGPPPPAKAGDKAGAAIVTAVVVASMLGTLAWISSSWFEGS